VPRYLRWIAAVSAGLTAQFAFFMLFAAIAVGTDNKSLDVSVGIAASLGSTFIAILPALAVSDWLAKRYPVDASDPEVQGPAPESVSDRL